jgi:hypothetical protein
MNIFPAFYIIAQSEKVEAISTHGRAAGIASLRLFQKGKDRPAPGVRQTLL